MSSSSKIQTGERLVLADDNHDGEPATLPLLPMLAEGGAPRSGHARALSSRSGFAKAPRQTVERRDRRRNHSAHLLIFTSLMSLALIQESAKEVRRLAIAGSPLAVGDFRLKKLIPPLEQAGAKVPVFAQVAKAISDLVNGNEADSAANLLNLSTLLNAILYTQGQIGRGRRLSRARTVRHGCASTRTTAARAQAAGRGADHHGRRTLREVKVGVRARRLQRPCA